MHICQPDKVQRALFSTEDERVAIFDLVLVHVLVCLHLRTIPLANSDQMVPWLGLGPQIQEEPQSKF